MKSPIEFEAGPADAGPANITLESATRSTFPATTYRETVLSQVFEDAKLFFLDPLIAIQYAHTLMLAQQSLMTSAEAAACLRALGSLDLAAIRNATYDGTFEDLFFLMEKLLALSCGPYLAGKMHTARSRNDIDLTMYRIVLRERLIQTVTEVTNLRGRLIDLAWEHRASLMPAYTHNQPAQPTTLGHYLMAAVECLERDTQRLQAAYGRVNRSPMGACAITTTGFPIDRSYVAQLLGFDGLQVNSYGAIAAVDYLTESCSALAVCMLNLGRFAQDLLQWSTVEFGYLRLSDGYVQISSIMPQKRNPVPLEHVRILSSRALTQSHAILVSLHNTPFTDINDSEDDLQPLVYSTFDEASRSLRLLTGVLDEAEFQVEHMSNAAEGSFLTVTELADTLVRNTSLSFRDAHEIVSAAVRELSGHYDLERMAAAVERRLANHTPAISVERDIVQRSLLATNFIAVRTIPGGPASQALDPEILRARSQCETDRGWLQVSAGRLRHADELRKLETVKLLSLR